MGSNMAINSGGTVRVRFPPSPTGPLHLGGARTALFNWLFARQKGGIFVFRMEDTDKERSKREYEDEIIEAITWLGLDWDEGIRKEKEGKKYRQSERSDIYRGYLEKLLKEKKAYWCYCSKEDLEAHRQLDVAEGRAPRYSGRCRNLTKPPAGKKPEVIRFKTPETTIQFKDLIRGSVKFDTSLLDDFVIAKDTNSPLYNFAVVIDDDDSEITHVIRGEEHLSNTPRQILILQALGMNLPQYAHLPLVLNSERAKLSKRNADVALLAYRDKGILPEAMINFLILMGWHPSDNQEVFTLEELISKFDITRVQKAGAVFNEEKLAWLNREHIKRLPLEELEKAVEPYWGPAAREASPELRHEALAAVRERLTTLAEINELTELFFKLPDYPPELLVWKQGSRAEAKQILMELADVFMELPAYDAETLPKQLAPLVEKYGKGNVLWPLRTALSGLPASPDPFVIAAVLGKHETIERLRAAANKLNA